MLLANPARSALLYRRRHFRTVLNDQPIFSEFKKLLPDNELTKLQRLEFYDKAREPDTALIIATGDQRNWANLLLTMGFIKHPEGKGDY